MNSPIPQALTFDDVRLVPACRDIVPPRVSTKRCLIEWAMQGPEA